MKKPSKIRFSDINTGLRQRTSIISLLKIKSIWWMLFDALVAIMAMKLAYKYAPKAPLNDIMPTQLIAFSIFAVIAGNISGLYDKDTLIRRAKLVITVTFMILLSIIGLLLFSDIFLYENFGRYILLTIFVMFFLISGGIRILYHFLIRESKINVLFVGNQTTVSNFTDKIKQTVSHYRSVGFADNNKEVTSGYLGDIQSIPQICHNYNIGLVVITDDYIDNSHILDQCLISSKLRCDFMDQETFFEQAFEQVLIDKIDSSWFYRAKLGIHSNFQVILKRFGDIVLAFIGLIITVLISPFIWILNCFSSPGPILYSQIRCGQFGRPFKIYKFRTMKVGAEINVAQWATQNDDRVTSVGKFLRKLRLDEFPQFWNVLVGHMSFVGPRPERPELVKKIDEKISCFYFRHWVKPGITGFAQIRYRYGASVEDAREKLAYDLYYIKNWSIMMDLQIMLRTISAIMRGSR